MGFPSAQIDAVKQLNDVWSNSSLHAEKQTDLSTHVHIDFNS